MTSLQPGDRAPEFSATDQFGNAIALHDFPGRKVILYFYPKDNTPGCTAEACGFRDNYQILIGKGYSIIGVSADNERSHKNFSEKYVLPFTLIADKEKKIIKEYGVWGKKKLYGKEVEGIIRMTFIIDEQGMISHILTKVDTKDPAGQIMRLMNLNQVKPHGSASK
ncbi:MAG: thioredoxin-dependent thiol peroxidase [Bacteroidales bacterium]|jgi:peroxiredoxin Q/BCP|nr:thioredoxin-dependent thiol peroxidase [Bacteroidales bacterium]